MKIYNDLESAGSNLAKIVFRRTYSRRDSGRAESFVEAAERAIRGNVRNFKVSQEEQDQLRYLVLNRKAGPAGRGWWFSGSPNHDALGGAALSNCWFLTMDDWEKWVLAQDLLMLGGGVGMSVEHKYVSKLPKVKKGVTVEHRLTKDADFIVPDSREGWNKLLWLVLEAHFKTGKSFTFSTVCVRGYGEPIKGFGGTASGPLPLVECVEKVSATLRAREGKHVRPIDAADVLCSVGEMVVMGNVRRSALIVIGDPWDKDFLRVKRWDLGPLPTQRAKANFSVACDDVEDLHPLFWASYQVGEPIGLVNLSNVQKFGRMGELKKDTARGVNPCAEATLEDKESCNLQEIALPNLHDEDEFVLAARLMHRWGKRVSLEDYRNPDINDVVHRNLRIGTGVTGCLMSPLFKPEVLDRAYAAVQAENAASSAEYGCPESIRTTVVKPSGTQAKQMDLAGYEGIHAAYSRYMIQRIRFASNDPDLPKLIAAGHHSEPEIKLDGTLDHRTQVVDFYQRAPDGYPVADEDWTTWKQLDVVKMAQAHWADQSVSVTVYYDRTEVPRLREWLSDNYKYLKTISFLCHSGHGFLQAPKEAITRERYEKLSGAIRPLDLSELSDVEGPLSDAECPGGACPVR